MLRVFEMKNARKIFGPVKEGTKRRKLECTTTVNREDILQRKDVKFKEIPPTRMVW